MPNAVEATVPTPAGIFDWREKMEKHVATLEQKLADTERRLEITHNHVGALMIYAFVTDPDPSKYITESLRRLPFDQTFVDNAQHAARQILQNSHP